MSKKDYLALARMLARLKGHADMPEQARRIVANEVAQLCAADNWRFDYNRFISACNLEDKDSG